MSTADHTEKNLTECILAARSLAHMADGQVQVLRYMISTTMLAEGVVDWIALAKAWAQEFEDNELATQCSSRAEDLAETDEEFELCVRAWSEIGDNQRAVDCYKKVIEQRAPDISLDDPPWGYGTTSADYVRRVAREWTDEAAVKFHSDRAEALMCLAEAESLAEETSSWLRVAERWLKDFQDGDNAIRCMEEAECAVDTPNDWVQIALRWKDDFQDGHRAIACMWEATGGTVSDWEDVLRAWKGDFKDLDNFRHALNVAYGEGEPFDQMTSMITGDLEAFDLVAKATKVDLGTLTGRSVSRVAVRDEEQPSARRHGSLAGHYRFNLSQDRDVTIHLTSDVDHYLYLIEGEDPNGATIAMDQDDDHLVALSRIKKHLESGTYTIEAATDRVEGYGIFHLQIYVADQDDI